MSLKEVFKEIIIKIDSSEKANIVSAIFQILSTASIGVYTIYEGGQTDLARWSIYIFWIFQPIVLLYLLIMLLISERYGAIKLRLKSGTGVLYDATTTFRNVSIRDETLNIILDKIGDINKAYTIGKEVGENFYSALKGVHNRQGKKYEVKDQLEKWCEYDSSSGLGKFEVHSIGPSVKFKITSPFVGTCPKKGDKPKLKCCCNFLSGYIVGNCSNIYGKEFEIECEHESDPPYCLFTLDPVETKSKDISSSMQDP